MVLCDPRSNPKCPHCRAPLQFRNRFPVLSGECATEKELDSLDRLRYVSVWLCVTNGCDYCREANSANAPTLEPPAKADDHRDRSAK